MLTLSGCANVQPSPARTQQASSLRAGCSA
ncbi:TPA: hypothetical protein ACR6ZI_000465 [Klebsiella pneumoniae]